MPGIASRSVCFVRRLRTAALGGVAAALLATPVLAQQCGDSADGFQRWLDGFKQQAIQAGISPATIDASLTDVAYDPAVISHDRSQHGFGQNFAQFAARRVSSYRIKKGKTMLVAHAEALDKIQARYGVPAPILVAIWGLESEFGADTGRVRTFDALATLAYDCRRPAVFRQELFDALQIVQRGDVEASEMRGAWAGEIGQTQFMPSAYLKYATGVDGPHSVDLIGNPEDALASTANFLRGKGWKPGQGWHEGEPNYAALLQWNAAPVYAKTIGYFADKLAEGDEKAER
jgi:lytic murein transglycosylase